MWAIVRFSCVVFCLSLCTDKSFGCLGGGRRTPAPAPAPAPVPVLAPTNTCPRIISRSQWGARSARLRVYIGNSLPYVFVHHAVTPSCTSQSSCSARVRNIQSDHMDTILRSDIGYSFLVGEDGNVYEGRGWNKEGAHTFGYNSVSYGICMIGDYSSHLPNAAAMNALKQLIKCGVSQGKISSIYTLKGHRDVRSTACPGTTLYNKIRTWPHYG